MAASHFSKGDVIVVPFPFSDLSTSKKRPAIIIAVLQGDDIILCQITSETRVDNYSLVLEEKEFKTGSLKQISTIRPNRLFTADKSIILYKAGSLQEKKIKEVEEALVKIVKT